MEDRNLHKMKHELKKGVLNTLLIWQITRLLNFKLMFRFVDFKVATTYPSVCLFVDPQLQNGSNRWLLPHQGNKNISRGCHHDFVCLRQFEILKWRRESKRTEWIHGNPSACLMVTPNVPYLNTKHKHNFVIFVKDSS